MFDFLLKPFTIKMVDYEDIIYAIKNPDIYLIINTLPIGEQHVLIKGTISSENEETTINTMITNYETDNITVIVYGKNANDETSRKKYHQIQKLGFRNVFLYSGGLFEWLLLQDIFGDINFPTTGKTNNFLYYKPPSVISKIKYTTIKYN